MQKSCKSCITIQVTCNMSGNGLINQTWNEQNSLVNYVEMSWMAYLQHNTNSLFKHGQDIQVALLFHEACLTDPVFGKLLGHCWQPWENILHLVWRATLWIRGRLTSNLWTERKGISMLQPKCLSYGRSTSFQSLNSYFCHFPCEQTGVTLSMPSLRDCVKVCIFKQLSAFWIMADL